MSDRKRISETAKFLSPTARVTVAWSCWWRRCDTLRTSGFVDDVTIADNGEKGVNSKRLARKKHIEGKV